MENTFIVLRNNKQEGPYNLAQMANIGLQAGDLVNQENGIAGWQYAMEIDELQPLFSAPQTAQKGVEEVQEAEVDEMIMHSEPAPIEETEFYPQIAAAAPIIEVVPSPDYDFAGSDEAAENVEITPEPFLEEQPYVAASAPLVSAKILEVEKADTEEPYYEPAPRQKASKRGSNNQSGRRKKLVAAGALALLVLAALFALPLFKQNGNGVGGNNNSNGSENAVAVSNRDDESENQLRNELPQTEIEKAEKPATVVKKENDKPEVKEEALVKGESEEKEANIEKTADDTVAEVKKDSTVETKKAPDLTQQVYLRSNFTASPDGAGVYNLDVTLENKSTRFLKTIAVNVLYRDEKDKVVNKQTIYFSDVAPGATVSRPASQHKQATSVTCELGLIISDGALYYSN